MLAETNYIGMSSSFIENLSACFNSLSVQDISFLNEKKTQVAYNKGETLIKQNAFAPHVLFLNSGFAITTLETAAQKQINVHLAQQGDYIGFSALFSDTYRYSATTLTPAQVCMIEKEALSKVLKANPGFAWQITARNWQHEVRYLEMINNLSYKQMRG
ncbi:MAG: Crp/Fnr family transcriptional regulator, partial [Bacteroidia bacterium]